MTGTNNPVIEIVRSDRLKKYVGENYFSNSEAYNQKPDKMRAMSKLVLQLGWSHLIEKTKPNL